MKPTSQTVYKGLLECPFKSGFIEFEFHEGDRVAELLKTVDGRWGTSYGWATSSGFSRIGARREGEVYGMVEGWLLAAEDASGSYVALRGDDQIPITPRSSEEATILPAEDGWYLGAVAHGCYNWESFGYPTQPFKIPFKRLYRLPSNKRFDVRLIALVAVSGG